MKNIKKKSQPNFQHHIKKIEAQAKKWFAYNKVFIIRELLTILANDFTSGVRKLKPFSPLGVKVRINVSYNLFTLSATQKGFLTEFSNFYEIVEFNSKFFVKEGCYGALNSTY